jgi:hypothetical protein
LPWRQGKSIEKSVAKKWSGGFLMEIFGDVFFGEAVAWQSQPRE